MMIPEIKTFIDDNATQLIPEIKALEAALEVGMISGLPTNYRRFPLTYELMTLISPDQPAQTLDEAIAYVKDWAMNQLYLQFTSENNNE